MKDGNKKGIILKITVFLAGAIVMIFELIGSRVVAPYVGNSTFVWTSLIGVILASLSLGYYVGGKLADKQYAFLAKLSLIILLSAWALLFTYLIKDIFLPISAIFFTKHLLQTLIVSLVLFFLASFLLGMVSPYALKLALSDLQKSGSTAGSLYALSTLGSILGTFLAGFFLIPILGTNELLISLTLLLSLLALFISFRFFLALKIMTIVLVMLILIFNFSFTKNNYLNNFVDVDTQYSRIWIFDREYEEDIIRVLLKDNVSHSGKFLNKDGLVFDYIKIYDLATEIKKTEAENSAITTLMVGGAAYTYPQYFLNKYDEAEMTVVEIDPKMTDLAKTYFNLDASDKDLKIVHQDARIFLSRNSQKYDIIYGDAFSSHYSPPFHLTTYEALSDLKKALKPDGLAVINIISALEGDNSKFFAKEYNTLKKLFKEVIVFSVGERSSDQVKNIILLCTDNEKLDKSTIETIVKKYPASIYSVDNLAFSGILTDNFAPVEYYGLKTN